MFKEPTGHSPSKPGNGSPDTNPQNQGQKKTREEILAELEKQAQKVAIVDVTKIADAEARDAGAAAIQEDFEETKGFKNVFKRIWKHNIMREYNKYAATKNAEKEIYASNNIYANEKNDLVSHEAAMRAITDRFLSEYEETVRTDQDEARKQLETDDTSLKIKNDVKNLVFKFAQGSISEMNFQTEKDRLLSSVRNAQPEIIKEGKMYADNIKDIALQVKQALDHGLSLDEIDKVLKLDVTVGRAEGAIRSEVKAGKVHRLVERITSTQVGAILGNEVVIAMAVFGAAAILESQTKIAAKAALFVGGIGLAGGIAALKENMRMKDDRVTHLRERAKGQRMDDKKKNPRRDEMERTLYEMRNASELVVELNESLYLNGDSKQGLRSFESPEDLERAMMSLVEIESRMKLSGKNKIDLVGYSNLKSTEIERTQLEISRARAKQQIKNAFENGIISPSLAKSKDFKSYFSTLVDSRERVITEGDINVKDKVFAKIKRKAVVRKAVEAMGSAVVGGFILQEIGAYFSPKIDGFVESVRHGVNSLAEKTTLLQGLKEKIIGGIPFDIDQLTEGVNFQKLAIGGHVIKFPEGITYEKTLDTVTNTEILSLFKDGELVAENLSLSYDELGQFSPDTQEALKQAGFELGNGFVVDSVGETIENVSVQDYVENSEEMVDIERMQWYDNDTGGTEFDKNELGLWWGGENGSGIDSSGNVVFSIEQMTSGGSYHGEYSVDVKDKMSKGLIKLAFSLSEDTQDRVFFAPVDSDGNILIDPNSELGKQCIEFVGGKPTFIGKYAEIVETLGQNEAGAEQVKTLSTIVGEGVDSVTVENMPARIFVNEIVERPDRPFMFPPITPFVGRRPLERMKSNEQDTDQLSMGQITTDQNRITPEADNRVKNREDRLSNPNAQPSSEERRTSLLGALENRGIEPEIIEILAKNPNEITTDEKVKLVNEKERLIANLTPEMKEALDRDKTRARELMRSGSTAKNEIDIVNHYESPYSLIIQKINTVDMPKSSPRVLAFALLEELP